MYVCVCVFVCMCVVFIFFLSFAFSFSLCFGLNNFYIFFLLFLVLYFIFLRLISLSQFKMFLMIQSTLLISFLSLLFWYSLPHFFPLKSLPTIPTVLIPPHPLPNSSWIIIINLHEYYIFNRDLWGFENKNEKWGKKEKKIIFVYFTINQRLQVFFFIQTEKKKNWYKFVSNLLEAIPIFSFFILVLKKYYIIFSTDFSK